MPDPVTLTGIVKTGIWGVNRTEVQPFVTRTGERAIADFLREYELFRISAEADPDPVWTTPNSSSGPQFGCIGSNTDGIGTHFYGSSDSGADATQILCATLKGTIASATFTLGDFNTVWQAPERWRVFNTSVCNGRHGKPVMLAEIQDTSQNLGRIIFLWAYKHGAQFHRMGGIFTNIQGVGGPEIHYDPGDDFYYISHLVAGVTLGGKIIYYTVYARTWDFITFQAATNPLLVPPMPTPGPSDWSAELWNNSDVGSIVWPGETQVDFYYMDGNQAVNDTSTAPASVLHDIRHAYYPGGRAALHRALFA